MDKNNNISASLEDYLEAIHQIISKKQAVRSKDIAKRLDVAPPSVTNALRSLEKQKLINYAPYDVITMTPQGQKIANKIFKKHSVLKRFFTKVLAIDESAADECACKIEHVISDKTLERFVEFIKFEERSHSGGTRWIDGKGFVSSENKKI